MVKANVATAKNQLSRLLRQVKRGQRVIITERNHPIAQLLPYSASDQGADTQVLAALYEDGVLIEPSEKRLDVTAFLSLPTATLARGQGLADAVLAEREDSR
jgi:prevent-host-death family protein